VREEKIKVGEGVIEAIARHANGHMRDAESLLGQVIALGGQEASIKGKEITLAEAELIIPRSYISEAIDILEYLTTKDAGAAVSYLNNLADHGADLKVFAAEFINVTRRLLLAKVSPDLAATLSQDLGEAVQVRLVPLISKLEADFLAAAIERFITAQREIKDSPFPQLPLELGIVDLCFGRLFGPDSVVSPFTNRFSQEAIIKRPMANKGPIKPLAKADKTLASNFSSEKVKSAWQELLIKIKQHNHSLSFVLKSCQLIGLEDSTLRLVFKHKFHHDRLNEPAIRQLVENLLAEITGQKLLIATSLDPDLVLMENTTNEGSIGQAPSAERVAGAAVAAAEIDSTVIDNLLKTFGGKVVS
jgi:DNA polymerase III gamma/tau subunit